MIDNKDEKSKGSESSLSSFLRVVKKKKDIPQKISLGIPTTEVTPYKSGNIGFQDNNFARYDNSKSWYNNFESFYNRNFYWRDYGSAMINYARHIDFSTLRDKKSILKKGIVRVKELITSLNIPKKVRIVVNRNEIDDDTKKDDGGLIELSNLRGCSALNMQTKKDCIKLFLQTSVLDSSKPTEDKINIITSEGIHECAHILFSSNNIFFDFRKNLSKILGRLFNENVKTFSQSDKLSTLFNYFKELSYCYTGTYLVTDVYLSDTTKILLKDLESSIKDGNYDVFNISSYWKGDKYQKLNILRLVNLIQYIIILSSLVEDKRVEKLLLKDRSGLEDYLKILADFKYDELDDLDNILRESRTESSILMKDVLKYILNPEKLETLSKLNTQENKELLVSLTEILNRDPSNSYESCLMALSIYEKLNEHLCKRFEVPLILHFSGELNTNLEGSLISSSQTVNPGLSINQIEEVNDNIRGTSPSMAAIADDFVDFQDSNIYCEEFTKTLTNGIKRTISPDVSNSMGELINGILNDDILEDVVDDDEVYFYKIDRDTSEEFEGSESRKLNQMLMLQKTVANYSSVLRKSILSKFKNQKISIYGCKTGTLNPARIVEAYQGVESVYTQPASVETARVVLTLLIDESGSMSCDNRINTVKKAAILLVNAFGNDDNIDLYIYGHTACVLSSKSTDILVYKEGSKKGDRIINDLIALSNIQDREENMDSHAIYSVVKRVDSLAYPKGADKEDKKHIFIIMSDGSPYTPYFNGEMAIRDVREKVNKAQEEFGVDIIQCSIYNIEESNRMFDTVIELQNDLSNFVPNLSRVINDLLTKKIETKIKRF